MDVDAMIAYGPVPSRRLGQSIGVNHVPPKICSYSCIYCQLGNTIKMQSGRTEFYIPINILNEVKSQVNKAEDKGERMCINRSVVERYKRNLLR